MKERDEDLRDDMLSHMIQETGYDASVDFTAQIMEEINPPEKIIAEKTLPEASEISWTQLLGIGFPVLMIVGVAGFAFLNGFNTEVSTTITDLISSQPFYIAMAVGVSSGVYFTFNQVFLKRV